MTATAGGVPVTLQKLFLSFPVEGDVSMQTSHFLHLQLLDVALALCVCKTAAASLQFGDIGALHP